MIFNLLYDLGLSILALIALPKMLFQLIVYKKYRNNFLQRFGIKFPKINRREGAFLIWVHAVSMGETKAIATLMRDLKNEFKDIQIIVSSTTETGHNEAKKSLAFADDHVYLPFDFSWVVKSIISKVKPNAVILCESDFWYNFLRLSKKYGASTAVVNGKLSERSMLRFKKYPFFSKRLWNQLDVFCVQNELYYSRFLEAHVPANKMHITGNLKLDENYPHLSPQDLADWKIKLGIQPNQLVLTVGSTHDPEEKILVEVLKDIWKTHPELKAIIVPRHPERFKEVAQLFAREEIPYVPFTKIHEAHGQEKIILMDTMGMLRMCYQLSDIAIVGGSYTSKVGGHNILEPCWYGKPVLFGPHMHTQLELVDYILKADAGKQVTQEYLTQQLQQLVENSSERKMIGERGIHLVANLKGSTKRTRTCLNNVIKPF